MPRYKLTLKYEGTRYSGWQRQINARTVQGALDEAVRTVCKTTSYELYGAGRTDAGVHALHQIAHLEVKNMLTPDVLRYRLNDELPADVNIVAIERAHPAFHARHDATSRSYLYQISRRRTAFGQPDPCEWMPTLPRPACLILTIPQRRPGRLTRPGCTSVPRTKGQR